VPFVPDTFSSPEHALEGLVISVFLEDRHPRIRAVQNVINQTAIGRSSWSPHPGNLTKPTTSVNKRFLTPFLLPVKRVGRAAGCIDAVLNLIGCVVNGRCPRAIGVLHQTIANGIVPGMNGRKRTAIRPETGAMFGYRVWNEVSPE